MTELDGSIQGVLAHIEKARYHIEQAYAMFSQLPPGATMVTDESLKGIRAAKQPPSGWLSDNRCGEDEGLATWQNRIGARPHTAHTYGQGNAQWCDGFV